MNDGRRIILASTSPYRRALLERLHIPFEVCHPDFEEAQPGSMPPEKLVQHNTLGKAASVVDKFPDTIVIASDQLAVCADTILGKPGNHDAACQQLQQLSGKSVNFLTGIALIENGEEHYATTSGEGECRRQRGSLGGSSCPPLQLVHAECDVCPSPWPF